LFRVGGDVTARIQKKESTKNEKKPHEKKKWGAVQLRKTKKAYQGGAEKKNYGTLGALQRIVNTA